MAGQCPSPLRCPRASGSLSDDSFTDLFNYILSAYCGSGTVLGPRGTAVNKASELAAVLQCNSPGEGHRTKESIDRKCYWDVTALYSHCRWFISLV